jgi:hypothetical protein
MKVGDKVYIELEVERIDESNNRFVGGANSRSYWHSNEVVITQLPIQEGRWMMVSDDKLHCYERRFVIGKADGLFISYSYKHPNFSRWKYAKEIPIKRKLTMQEIAEKFGEDVDNIEIEK